MDAETLTPYQEFPMFDGDVVVLLAEHRVATEVTGLANAWDEVLCRNLAAVMRELGVGEVELGIARPGSVLLDEDHRIAAELRAELAGSGITVLPLVALPAAA